MKSSVTIVRCSDRGKKRPPLYTPAELEAKFGISSGTVAALANHYGLKPAASLPCDSRKRYTLPDAEAALARYRVKHPVK